MHFSYFDQCGSTGPGGAVAVSTSAASAKIIDSVFSGCYSENSGGALAVSDNSRTNVTSCSFRNNNAVASGGAIYVNAASLTVGDATGIGNVAEHGGGGVLFWTGGFPPAIMAGSSAGATQTSLCGTANLALYGDCTASTYQSLEVQGVPTPVNPAFPGVGFPVRILKKDAYNQIITTDSSSLVQAVVVLNSSANTGPNPTLTGALGSFQGGIATLDIQVTPHGSDATNDSY